MTQARSNIGSRFRLFNDGIGIGNVSFRVSNFSLQNLPRNIGIISTWAFGLSVAAAKSLGIVTPDGSTHYRMVITRYRGAIEDFRPLNDPETIIQAIANRTCGVDYSTDPTIVEQYSRMHAGQILSLNTPDAAAALYRRDFDIPNHTLEACLQKVMNYTLTEIQSQYDKEASQKTPAYGPTVAAVCMFAASFSIVTILAMKTAKPKSNTEPEPTSSSKRLR